MAWLKALILNLQPQHSEPSAELGPDIECYLPNEWVCGEAQYLQQHQEPAFVMKGMTAQMWRCLPLPLTERLAQETSHTILTGCLTPLIPALEVTLMPSELSC